MAVHRVRQRLATLLKVALALSMLAALWAAAFLAVTYERSRARDDRIRDRQGIAHALALSVVPYFEARDAELAELTAQITSGPQAAVDAYMSSQRLFGTDALVVDRSRRLVAAGRDRKLVGFAPRECVTTTADARRQTDTGFADLVGVAVSRDTPVTWGVLAAPGDCRHVLGAAVARGADVVVVVSELARATSKLAGLEAWAEKEHSTRIFLVGPEVALVPGSGAQPATRSVVGAIERSRGRSAHAEVWRPEPDEDAPAGTEPASVLSAVARVDDEWHVVVEQDSGWIESDPFVGPVRAASTVTALLAALLLLVAVVDSRRRRAHRRAEVAKSDFFAIAGHELRTPLTALRGFAETLSDRWADLDDPKRRMLVDRMLPQARRLGRTIERTLTAASINAGTYIRPAPRRLDPADVVLRVTERFTLEAPLHRFVVDADPSAPWIVCDPSALEQVLEQLLDNAVKYSPSGGEVGVRIQAGKRQVRLIVEDSGVGLPADVRRIFEPLVQGEDVDRRVHGEGGVGVGLYIVRTLVEAMGGSVHAERLDPGSRFVVRLRRAPAARAVTRTS